jgi:hypothetical protein
VSTRSTSAAPYSCLALTRENYVTQRNHAILGGKNNKQQKNPLFEFAPKLSY